MKGKEKQSTGESGERKKKKEMEWRHRWLKGRADRVKLRMAEVTLLVRQHMLMLMKKMKLKQNEKGTMKHECESRVHGYDGCHCRRVDVDKHWIENG